MTRQNHPDSVRIFAGCDPNDCDLEQMMVLEYSLTKHASLPVEIHWMRLSRDPESPWYSDPARRAGWRTERWATPFSGFRWAVPEVAAFTGRAIYMDTDMLALGDIAALWRTPIPFPAIVRARTGAPYQRFCVALWDCRAAQHHLPALRNLQRDAEAHSKCSRHFRGRAHLVAALDPAWNCIDGEDLPARQIRMLHYSDMGTQFTHARAMPRLAAHGRTHWFDGTLAPHPRQDLAALFEQYYAEALASGRRPEDYRNAAPFGPLIKKSERNHQGNPTTRPDARPPRWPFRIRKRAS